MCTLFHRIIIPHNLWRKAFNHLAVRLHFQETLCFIDWTPWPSTSLSFNRIFISCQPFLPTYFKIWILFISHPRVFIINGMSIYCLLWRFIKFQLKSEEYCYCVQLKSHLLMRGQGTETTTKKLTNSTNDTQLFIRFVTNKELQLNSANVCQ